MSRPDNYAIMEANARRLFLTYDQSAILAKSPATADERFLFLPVLDMTCRVCRETGEVRFLSDGACTPAAPHDTLTVYDYLCDAQPGRSLSGQWCSTASFGHMVHTNLAETSATPLEKAIDSRPDAFIRACRGLGGVPFPACDIGFTFPFFPDLPITVQFWHSDEEFPPRLRFLWDGNSLQFLRYETLYYALGLLQRRLKTLMES